MLSEYINRQKKSKKQIADDLSMSRSNLYQLFGSQTLTEETKKKFEEYFNEKIFIDNARENMAKLIEASRQQPVQYAKFNNDEYIQLLRDQIKLMDAHNVFITKTYEDKILSMENSLKECNANLKIVLDNQRKLKTELAVAFRLVVQQIVGPDNKGKIESVTNEFDTLLEAALH